MLSEQLRMINERGLDAARVMRKAAELNALNGSGIAASKLELVLEECSRDFTCKEVISRPELVPVDRSRPVEDITPERATELAEKMNLPLSRMEWDSRKAMYERVFSLRLPESDDIISHFGTWESFWSSAGFDMEHYSPKDIIDLTLRLQGSGFLTRNSFDAQFPDVPSSSYVLDVFGGNWKSYSEAVERARTKIRRPHERIRELLGSGVSVKQTVKSIVAEFAGRPEVPEMYHKQSNRLYKHVSALKKRMKEELNRQRLSRDEIAESYSTLEQITDTSIRMFRLYNGRHKAEKRMEIAEDVCDLRISRTGESPRFAYLGLEGPNFGSYVLLQTMLDNGSELTIDPAQSLVTECDKNAAECMRSIVENHDVIEGGEIFDGLSVESNYLNYALGYNRDKCFDIINLDYMGGWSRTKEEEITKLFRNGHISDSALLYVTLLNSDIEKYRVRNGCSNGDIDRQGYGTDDQRMLLRCAIQNLCDRHGYTFREVRCEEYFDTQKMIFMGFHVEKRPEKSE